MAAEQCSPKTREYGTSGQRSMTVGREEIPALQYSALTEEHGIPAERQSMISGSSGRPPEYCCGCAAYCRMQAETAYCRMQAGPEYCNTQTAPERCHRHPAAEPCLIAQPRCLSAEPLRLSTEPLCPSAEVQLLSPSAESREDSPITPEDLKAFEESLRRRERSASTIEKYLHDVKELVHFLDGRAPTQELAVAWKKELLSEGKAPATVNCRISAANAFFAFRNSKIHLEAVRMQRQMFRNESRDLTRAEYRRLVRAAQETGRKGLSLLIETICSTGIRVSEVKHITVEAAAEGRAQIHLKGKIRTILLPKTLCRKLRKYAKEKKISAGEIFLTKNGRSMSRKLIWAQMKALCRKAGVAPNKVFPHNLRHLFARSFYEETHDVVQLADVLGHSDLSTTRIYLITTGKEYLKRLESLRLVC